jgi:hypothetical protein
LGEDQTCDELHDYEVISTSRQYPFFYQMAETDKGGYKMRCPNGITILSLVFLFAMSGSMAQGAVAGAQIEFIADEANFVNGDWKSSGVAGKKLKGGAVSKHGIRSI